MSSMKSLSNAFYHQPSDFILRTAEIHVWLAFLDQSLSLHKELSKTLSLDEHNRVARYNFDKDKKRFIVRRGILRSILGNYLHMRPDRIRFCYNDEGKPALPDNANMQRIHFNLSHSDGLAIYAFSRIQEIGVDIEKKRPLNDMEQIVDSFFSKREKADFFSLSSDKKNAVFFNCWTRKEAFVKAIGQGLFYQLDAFDVSLTPGEEPELTRIRERCTQLNWTMKDIIPMPGYKGAVAVAGTGLKFLFYKWL